jgi:hypothetical protein
LEECTMRKWLLLILLVASAAYAAPRVTEALAAHLEEVSPTELVRVMVVMEAGVSQDELMALTDGLPREQRRVVVERECSRVAESSQRGVLAYLNERAATGHARDVKSLWIVNLVVAYADRETIARVSAFPGVSFVDWDEEVPVETLRDVVDGSEDEIQGRRNHRLRVRRRR